MHLLLAPLGAGVVLVETGQLAIVALVEGLILDIRPARVDFAEDEAFSVC